jgi:hypothetical protein
MGKLLVFQNDGIYLPNGEQYRPPEAARRVEVLREYDLRPDPRFQKLIDRKLGVNQFDEPLYRVIWGWNRLEWIGGLMSRYDESGRFKFEEYGLFMEPKYSYLADQCNRWIVEKWIPPEMYGTREAWEQDTAEINGMEETQALGPYPDRGDYELSFVLKDNKTGGFIQLCDQLVSDVVDVAQASREISAAKRRQYLEEQELLKEENFRKEVSDVWDDAAPAFGGRPNSTQANAPMHNTKPETAGVSKFPAPAPSGLSVA